MDSKELIEKLVELLSGIEDATTIVYDDFSDERTENMILVGIDDVEQLHFELPDYSYLGTILLDSYIDEDQDGATFKKISREIDERLTEYVMDKELLDTLFQGLEVVYLNIEKKSFTVTQKSNRFEVKVKIIQSKTIKEEE